MAGDIGLLWNSFISRLNILACMYIHMNEDMCLFCKNHILKTISKENQSYNT
jgi:PP-loop superfamily ATP-utilizing enzyme